MTTKTVAQRLDDLETSAAEQEARITALEAEAGVGAGATKLDDVDRRLGKAIDIIDNFLTSVGEVYDGAGNDLVELKSLDTDGGDAGTTAAKV